MNLSPEGVPALIFLGQSNRKGHDLLRDLHDCAEPCSMLAHCGNFNRPGNHSPAGETCSTLSRFINFSRPTPSIIIKSLHIPKSERHSILHSLGMPLSGLYRSGSPSRQSSSDNDGMRHRKQRWTPPFSLVLAFMLTDSGY